MSAAADGERAALAPLFQALWPVIVAYATRFVGDHALAEDCAQDALVKLFGQLARFDRERDALTWALTHATWQCRTERRKQQRRAEDSATTLATELEHGALAVGRGRHPALDLGTVGHDQWCIIGQNGQPGKHQLSHDGLRSGVAKAATGASSANAIPRVRRIFICPYRQEAWPP